MKIKNSDIESMYRNMIDTFEYITGVKEAPHREYPFNATGLLHAADNVLIFGTEDYQIKAAQRCRDVAISNIRSSRKL